MTGKRACQISPASLLTVMEFHQILFVVHEESWSRRETGGAAYRMQQPLQNLIFRGKQGSLCRCYVLLSPSRAMNYFYFSCSVELLAMTVPAGVDPYI
jgi:hypothetical protein